MPKLFESATLPTHAPLDNVDSIPTRNAKTMNMNTESNVQVVLDASSSSSSSSSNTTIEIPVVTNTKESEEDLPAVQKKNGRKKMPLVQSDKLRSDPVVKRSRK
jgi:hypothetical protein